MLWEIPATSKRRDGLARRDCFKVSGCIGISA